MKLLRNIAQTFHSALSPQPLPLSKSSAFQLHLTNTIRAYIAEMFDSLIIDMSDGHNDYINRMNSPPRQGFRDNFLYKLEPSHRVAYKEWWNFGVLLPFGATQAHFNIPNRFMYTSDKKLALDDADSPLNGWK
jgi:hypothetical protein